jgi:predicted PurR-regulated permease PerM
VTFGRWIGLLTFIVSAYILWRIRQVLLLLFVAVILATLLNRLARYLQSFGMKRNAAVALSVLSFLIVCGGFIAIVVPPLISQLQNFIALLPAFLIEVRNWLEPLQHITLGTWLGQLHLADLLTHQLQLLVGRVANGFVVWVSDLLAILVKVVLIVALAVMLLSNPQQYRQPFIRLFPAFYRSRADVILTQCEVDLVGWITGTGITAAFFVVVSALSLWVLGLPLVLVFALWTGFSELISNVGYIIAMLPPLAIALVDAPWKALPVIGIFFLLQQLESYIILPSVMKEHVSLPPAITLISQIVFATFFGIAGLFLALPLMIITKIWLRELVVKDILDTIQKT